MRRYTASCRMNKRTQAPSNQQHSRQLAEETCGNCAWSWAAGIEGQLLCLNPDSPHAYDVVPVELSCEEFPDPSDTP